MHEAGGGEGGGERRGGRRGSGARGTMVVEDKMQRATRRTRRRTRKTASKRGRLGPCAQIFAYCSLVATLTPDSDTERQRRSQLCISRTACTDIAINYATAARFFMKSTTARSTASISRGPSPTTINDGGTSTDKNTCCLNRRAVPQSSVHRRMAGPTRKHMMKHRGPAIAHAGSATSHSG